MTAAGGWDNAMRVLIQGSFFQEGSYGMVNRDLARALLATAPAGAAVAVEAWEGTPPADLPRRTPAWGAADVTIRQIWPPVWDRPPHGRLVVIQPWESGPVPAAWVGPARQADTIWVPSLACKAGWVQSGLDPDRIRVVPNGIPQTAARLLPPAPGPARFLFLGGPIYRKGIDILVDAFDRAFGGEPSAPAELVLKVTGLDTFYAGQSLLPQLEQRYPRIWPRVRVLDRFLPPAERDALLQQASALVLPYRGEGFGLPVLEAMAAGTLVVTSARGATRDFATPDTALLIPGHLRYFTRSGDEWLAALGYLFEPDPAALARLLQEVARDPGRYTPLRERALATARHYLWPAVGRLAWEALGDLAEGRPPRDPVSEANRAVDAALADGETGRLVEAVSRLVAVEDPGSALRLLEWHARRSGQQPLALARLSDQMAQAAAREPDRWARSPHRLRVEAALAPRRPGPPAPSAPAWRPCAGVCRSSSAAAARCGSSPATPRAWALCWRRSCPG
ncbi:protein of unknown function [Candidatus Hydrogenisulfobacillus filiaventi]|uniref:Glycosyl transferase family 1 domain-containing protein n=1 Tax=Candidatus Hydrogenisulfobacillus filiaventi TaxID=2707344 RepID=A0A6F8ZCF8_9FIRM|nr:protein of unknown function [Candidatus Hydrogenisulfobacillus filiaventi]